MSDYWLRIIPTDPNFVPLPSRARAVVSLLEEFAPDARAITPVEAEHVEFVHGAGNFAGVWCPRCGTELADRWWAERMTQAVETDFAVRDVDLPCCGATSDLNDLDYGAFPQGFARWRVDIEWPRFADFEQEERDALRCALGHDITVVFFHL